MADNENKSTGQIVTDRLTQIKDFLVGEKVASPASLPWDPDCTRFPTRHELPTIDGAPPSAAWVWGKTDYIGRLNLLTPTRVSAASKQIQTGDLVPVNLPLNHPDPPGFGREQFQHEIKEIYPELCYDDKYSLNTQSGTQWDGFRHFAWTPTKQFYNGTSAADIVGPSANHNCSIHHWAEHGIAGRGVLIDYWSYAVENGITYDPYTSHAISFEELTKCGKAQGIDIRPAAQGGDIQVGDLLFIRSGWVQAYRSLGPTDKRRKLALRGHGEPGEQSYAGIKQEEAMLDWLHDCYFAAVAGDAPAFECWPKPKEIQNYLHESILSLWGMPLGEMLDLERLSEMCKKQKRYTFFFSSMPANCQGGVGSHVNGQAIF